jgi:hypothetical protein
MMNIAEPFAGTGQAYGLGPWDEICLLELQSDPSPIVREWVGRVLEQGWRPSDGPRWYSPHDEIPMGDRIDLDPQEFDVQMW